MCVAHWAGAKRPGVLPTRPACWGVLSLLSLATTHADTPAGRLPHGNAAASFADNLVAGALVAAAVTTLCPGSDGGLFLPCRVVLATALRGQGEAQKPPPLTPR